MATRRNIYANECLLVGGQDEAFYCKFLAEKLLSKTLSSEIVTVVPLKLLQEILQVFKDLDVKDAFWYESSQ